MYDKSGKNYRCLACVGKFNLSVSAKVFTNDEGNLAVKLGSNEHKCKPQEIRILQKSNFKTEMIIEKNGKEVKMLTITDPIYYNKVFTYYFHTYRQCYYCKNCSKTKTYIKANLRVENGEEYIELSADKHVCC
uniref:Uncharacterized protein n=1 Tax=Panagrolaimus superbus TaxID=310955 RepID=A0A914Z4W5_9BILA